MAFICAVIDNGAIRSEFPDVPADRYAALSLAAEQQMRLYAIRPERRWAFNGASCAGLAGSGKVSVLFWLESLQSALRSELGIHEGRIQGQYLGQLVEGSILDQLLR